MYAPSQNAGNAAEGAEETEGLATTASEVQESTRNRLIAANIPPNAFPQTQNVVATANLGCMLDLSLVARQMRNVEYNPRRFNACICRIRRPVRATALIFRTGKVVLTGAKTEADSRLACRKIARVLQKVGYTTTFEEYKVQNLVASTACEFTVRLETLVLRHRNFASYEPEIFPGCIYDMREPKMVGTCQALGI
jgi:transcription initiation factor TFIID TATA-box-binding protein